MGRTISAFRRGPIMHFISRKPWDPSLHRLSEESIYCNRDLHRREFLASLGLGSAGLLAGSLSGCGGHKPDVEKLKAAAHVPVPTASQGVYPARNAAFEYGRGLIPQA